MSGPAHTETEVKIRVADATSAARLLESRGFVVTKPRHFERNLILDTPDRALRAKGQIVRLRQADGHGVLTFKGAAQTGLHKTREELEVEVSDLPTAQLVLERLGYVPAFVYEKYRTELGRPGDGGCVMLDETLVGTFFELEGTDEWIDRTAGELGIGPSEYLTASYGRLYLDWCAERGEAPSHMLLPDSSLRSGS